MPWQAINYLMAPQCRQPNFRLAIVSQLHREIWFKIISLLLTPARLGTTVNDRDLSAKSNKKRWMPTLLRSKLKERRTHQWRSLPHLGATKTYNMTFPIRKIGTRVLKSRSVNPIPSMKSHKKKCSKYTKITHKRETIRGMSCSNCHLHPLVGWCWTRNALT